MSDQRQDEAAALIQAVAAGQRQALGRLIALFGRDLTMLATRYLQSEADADEMVQDVFVRVWRNAARYDPAKAKVGTWLYRIAVNLCIDRQRKRAFLRFVGLDGAAREIPDPGPSAEDRVAGAAELALVRQAMDGLPNRQRMALLLSAVAGLENAEIARAMEISTGAVEQLLVRARKTLRNVTDSEKGGTP